MSYRPYQPTFVRTPDGVGKVTRIDARGYYHVKLYNRPGAPRSYAARGVSEIGADQRGPWIVGIVVGALIASIIRASLEAFIGVLADVLAGLAACVVKEQTRRFLGDFFVRKAARETGYERSTFHGVNHHKC